MPSVREIPTGDAGCASVNDSLVDAAGKLRDLGVNAISSSSSV